MNDGELMTIGAFARSCGLTPSALRFYADSGLLEPAVVDASSGYRYYAPEQVARATAIRQLRELDLSLPGVAHILSYDDVRRADEIIDAHVHALTARADTATALARAAKQSLRAARHPSAAGRGAPVSEGRGTAGSEGRGAFQSQGAAGAESRDEAATGRRGEVGGGVGGVEFASGSGRSEDRVEIPGLRFVAAVEAVLTATAAEPLVPALLGVRLEAAEGQLVLTATDRYRLATRTLVTGGEANWTLTAHGDDLRTLTPWLRRRPLLHLRPDDDRLELTAATAATPGSRLGDPGGAAGAAHPAPAGPATTAGAGADRGGRWCRVLAPPYPDYRAMLAALPVPAARVLVARQALLDALENVPAQDVRIRLEPHQAVGLHHSAPDTITIGAPRGTALTVAFRLATLHPTISSAIGPDVMLEFSAPDHPVLVRSADTGDLTAVAMPIRTEPTRTEPTRTEPTRTETP